jgi:hypothetical protein
MTDAIPLATQPATSQEGEGCEKCQWSGLERFVGYGNSEETRPCSFCAIATQAATSQEAEDSPIAQAKARQASRDASAIPYVEGSIYDGMAACIMRSERTIAHCAQYSDAIEIAAALAATPTPPTLSEDLRALVEALEPFAAACNITTAEDSESLYDSLAAEKLTWRDLRRARAALARAQGQAS